MCTGRVDLAFILRAFADGADGVFIAGCWPGECHYVTEGNYHALGNVLLSRRLLTHMGVFPDRMRIEWVAASEGTRFAEVMNDFVKKLKELGPLGTGEGMDGTELKRKLEAVTRLIPYLKLVERERLRLPTKSQEAYEAFYAGEEFNRLFDESIADKLAMSEMVLLLQESPLSTGELSEKLRLDPSDVSRHVNGASRRGWVRYDANRKRYALA